MSVVLTTDFLIERSHATEIFEILSEAYHNEDAKVIVHRPGGILGSIEQRKITSSGLSKSIKTEDEFEKYLLQMPSIVKNMHIPCTTELIINVSRGFSHAFSKCEKTKQLTYLYELKFDRNYSGFWNKIFKVFVSGFFIKKLKNVDILLVSSEELQKKLQKYNINSEVMPPPFRLSDYALFPESMFKHDFYLIDTRGLSLSLAREIVSFLTDRNERFQFLGPDDHLNELKLESESSRFFGERCSGEHAPVMAAAKAFFSFDTTKFSKMTMASLAVGRPVFILNNHRDVFDGVGIHFFEDASLSSFHEAYNKTNSFEKIEGQKLRANIMKFHDIKFKAQLKRVLEKFHSGTKEGSVNTTHECC